MNEVTDNKTAAGLSVIIAGGRDYELTPGSLALFLVATGVSLPFLEL